MYVKEKVEVVKTDSRFLSGHSMEAILVAEHSNRVTYPRSQRRTFQTRRDQNLILRMSLLLRESKSRSALSGVCTL